MGRPGASLGPAALVLAAAVNAACASDRAQPPTAALGDCLQHHADMRYAEAEQCYTAVAGGAADAWRVFYGRALLRVDRGGGHALVADLRRAVELQPDDGRGWLRLGDAEFKAGRYDAAAAAWERAAALPEPPRGARSPQHVVEVPLSAYARLGRARVELVRGDAASAARLLEQVTAEAPGFSLAFRVLADAYTALGREADAARVMSRAARLQPFAPYADPFIDDLAHRSRNPTFLLRLASEADLAVNGAWAEYLTRRALELEPDNPEVIAKLGRILRQVGRSEEALPYFQRYHALVPGDFHGVAQVGATLSDLGRYDEAEPYVRQALAGLDDATTHYNLALLLASTGRLDEAVAGYRAAIARDARHPMAHVNLAAVYARQGRLPQAHAALEQAVAMAPENPLVRTNLGLVLAQLGDRRGAIRELREALRADPSFTPAAEALKQLAQ